MIDPLPGRIFSIRLEKLKIFQNESIEEWYSKVKIDLIDDIKSLPGNSITIKKNKKNIDQALSGNIWEDMDDSYEFLQEKITPLMRFKGDFNLFQEQFLFKIEKLSLALLVKDKKEIETLKESIIKDIKQLPPNLQMVKDKKEQMNEILSEAFWKKLTLEKCEFLKDNFMILMKHKQRI